MEEPILMHCQEGALNQDTFAQKEFLNLRDMFGLKVAVETGTCLGYTCEFLAKNYEDVRTIEVSDKYYEIARQNRLQHYPHVKMFMGSSSDNLRLMLEGLGDDTFIFLDAHWGDSCPLKDELKQIAEAKIKPVIAIHDFVVPDHPELGFDCIHEQPFNFQWLKSSFDAIYGVDGYDHYYNTEAEGAKRGIIYLTPSEPIEK